MLLIIILGVQALIILLLIIIGLSVSDAKFIASNNNDKLQYLIDNYFNEDDDETLE